MNTKDRMIPKTEKKPEASMENLWRAVHLKWYKNPEKSYLKVTVLCNLTIRKKVLRSSVFY